MSVAVPAPGSLLKQPYGIISVVQAWLGALGLASTAILPRLATQVC
jgi:hypothetical protein